MALVSVSGGSDIRAAAPSDTLAQGFAFKVTPVLSPGYYVIENMAGSRALDVADARIRSGTNIQIYHKNGSGAQVWTITRNADGTYQILNANSRKALDVTGGSTTSGTNVQQYYSNTSNAQKWRITPSDGGWFAIDFSPNLSLTVQDGGTSNGCNVVVNTSDGSSAQRFRFIPTTYSEAGSYEIQVNRTQNVVVINKYDPMSGYEPYKAMICSTGLNNSTPLGTWSIKSKRVWGYLLGGVSGQYVSEYNGDFLFHSVPYYRYGDKASLELEEFVHLGEQRSMGCVRLQVIDAKWVFDNCPAGTRVQVYASPDIGPLGKPAPAVLNWSLGWDPTDPDPANPYR
jgi:lipoprotein-anchoring transpeptidase ErfK/SrfK